jgi:hypothetical protein
MSCLFNSLGHLLNIPPQTVRQTICDYLAANSPVLDGMVTHDILVIDSGSSPEQYIANMRQAHVWGGAIEIQAAVNIWKSRVLVQNMRDRVLNGNSTIFARDIEFIPIGVEPTSTLTIYWTGGHYEPVSKS